ncbi:MAG: hypothetical protein WC364_01215 [Eubacteriales bacterium]|jgi:hypothetical protein
MNRQTKVFQKWILVLISAALCLLALAGPAAADDPLPLMPAQYYGSVWTTEGQTVEEGIVTAYIDGALRSPEFDFTGGYYGDHDHKKLAVTGYSADAGKTVTFKVEVNGCLYSAQTYYYGTPVTIKWYSGDVEQVDLKIPPPTAIKGKVLLEKAQSSDPDPSLAGVAVNVKTGGSENIVASTVTLADGSYSVSPPSAGSYDVCFDRDDASWKEEKRPVTVVSGDVILPDVTLRLGDVNNDGEIDIFDLLWIAARMGLDPDTDPEAMYANIIKDEDVDIFDLLRVAQNMGL